MIFMDVYLYTPFVRWRFVYPPRFISGEHPIMSKLVQNTINDKHSPLYGESKLQYKVRN